MSERQLVPLAEAAISLGYKTSEAVSRAFLRQVLPPRFLIRFGRSLRVDLPGLLAHLREEAAERAETLR